jgi:hypothetical protein
MKTSLFHGAALAALTTMFTGCFATVGGPDGGVVAAGAGPRGAGVVVDPPGPLGLAVGTGYQRRRYVEPVYVEPAPVYAEPVVIQRYSRRVIYRDEPAYLWNGNYYRRDRGGYVVIR